MGIDNIHEEGRGRREDIMAEQTPKLSPKR